MTYHTARTSCRFGAPHVPLAATLDRDTGPRMSEAAYATAMLALARKEGQRAAVPQPSPTGGTRNLSEATAAVLGCIAERAPVTRKGIRTALGMNSEKLESVLETLTRGRLIQREGVARPRHAGEVGVFSLTPAGRARLDAGRAQIGGEG